MKKKLFVFMVCGLFFKGGQGLADEEYNANKAVYDAIGASAAYNAGYSGQDVTVAVMDNGVLLTHQEFTGQSSDLQQETYNAYAFPDHGTPVASLIAGAKNDLGMHGVAYSAKLLSFAIRLEGAECTGCYTDIAAWTALAEDTFNAVKIINNSFGASNVLGDATTPSAAERTALRALGAKDKLIVASAGNEMKLSPNVSPAGIPYYEASLKNNVISAIAYNPAYGPSSPYFLEGYTNLAQNAQGWSLTAPVGAMTAASNTADSAYDTDFSGTSAAAPVISGAAAVVSSAFPYMGGKQLADVLFSTADKNYANFSRFMIQENEGKKRVLFFTADDVNWTDASKRDHVRRMFGGGYSCDSENVECVEVSYEDVFGQGLLNLGKAVKGPGYFDANRLVAADFDGSQYLYPVDTKEYDSTWSNNIGQVKKDGNEADVGLKKSGSGQLTLSGRNTYLGETVVTAGSLRLTGSLAGSVKVSGGSFYLNGGSVSLATVSAAEGKITMDGGTAGRVVNAGEVRQSGGTVSAVENSKDYYLSGGTVSEAVNANAGKFYLNGGTVSGKIQNAGTVYNNAVLRQNIVNGGSLINNEEGTLYLTSTPASLDNFGYIALAPSAADPRELQQMQLTDLNLAGGSFVLDPNNFPKLGADRFYRVFTATGTLTVGQNFQQSAKIGQYLASRTQIDETAKTVSVTLDYLPLTSQENSPSLTQDESKAANVFERLFRNGKLDFTGYYFFDESGLKKQIGKMKEQIKPVRFSSLPLSGRLTRGVYTHILERQRVKDPMNYEGRMRYYTPSPRQAPAGNPYRQYSPEYAPQEQYRYKMPRQRDVYRQYRPENAPQEQYRYKVPRQRDVYRNYRTGRSGGNGYAMRNQVWGQAFMHDGEFDADKTAGSSKAKSSGTGFMFGWDFVISDDFLWGLTTGYAASTVKQDDDKNDVADWRFGAYFSKQRDFVSIDGVLMIGRQNYDKKRITALPTDTYTSTASYGGTSVEASLNVGYDVQQLPVRAGDVTMRPYIGLTVVKSDQDAYREKGNSEVNLSFDKASDTSVTLSPGIVLGFVADGGVFGYQADYVFADLRYDAVLSGGKPKGKARFSADTLQEKFEVSNDARKSSFSVGLGINGRVSKSTRLNFYANQSFGSKAKVSNYSLSLIYAF